MTALTKEQFKLALKIIAQKYGIEPSGVIVRINNADEAFELRDFVCDTWLHTNGTRLYEGYSENYPLYRFYNSSKQEWKILRYSEYQINDIQAKEKWVELSTNELKAECIACLGANPIFTVK